MTARRANRRVRLLLVVFVLAFAVMLLRALWLQGVRAEALGAMGTSQHREITTLGARRGTVYDRRGVQLAIGEQATTVYANPREVRDPRAAAVTAARDLGVDADAVYERLSDRSKGFVYIERKADPERAARLARRKLAGVAFYPEERRSYPQGSIAAQVLGYAGVDNRGLAGLELTLDRLLAGRPGRQTIVKDPFGRVIDVVSSVRERAGRDVVLTLDHTLQANVEHLLRQAVRDRSARGATAIVLNPRSGDVLAMASAPTFDANNFPRTWPPLQRNRAVEGTYEPGSTFKVVTVGGALADRLVRPGRTFTLAPSIQVADRTIHEAEPRGVETMTVAQILARSSNVGAVTLAQLLGKERLTGWIKRFGFGHKTGIELPAESGGIVLPPERWSGSTIGNVPIGHGIAVTPIQMAAAYAAIANRGVLVRPHLVERVEGAPPRKPRRRRVLPAHVAAQLAAMLRGVVLEGTGQLADVPGYQVAGKTGTAAKPEPGGGYSTERYVASFVGFVPASAPRFVILVAIDEPHGGYFGGEVAAPVFQEIAKFALQYFAVPPDVPGANRAARG
ncbi:MAG: penicillin-binding protein 2 [Actinomycetota bacterium]|nr:penicillin-binding protein 2 [Actinomycetota bacterium]